MPAFSDPSSVVHDRLAAADDVVWAGGNRNAKNLITGTVSSSHDGGTEMTTVTIEIAQADRDTPVIFYVFDLLYIDGTDLRRVPLEQRKPMLRRMLLPTPFVQYMDHFEADGLTAYDAAVGLGVFCHNLV